MSPPTNKHPSRLTYAAAGVDTAREEAGLKGLIGWVRDTYRFRKGLPGEAQLDIGYFANVVNLGGGLGLAITTDGVGSKLLIAQALGKFDTVGIDCVAMNVNDVICVGAEPISMVDSIFMEEAKPELLEEIGRGLYRGAEIAQINIVGGEIAQVKEMVKGARPGYAFDLSGTCVGTVRLDRVIVGQDIREGDVVIGLPSSGIHSNGLTLARRALLDVAQHRLDEHVPELGRTIGEELLVPCEIYVREVLAMLQAGLKVKALAHITSDGFLNLTRVKADVGYVLDHLPEPQPIFSLIQQAGGIADEEMFYAFNMGIGFCVVLDPGDADRAMEIAGSYGRPALRIGYAVRDEQRRVRIPQHGLIGRDGRFSREDAASSS